MEKPDPSRPWRVAVGSTLTHSCWHHVWPEQGISALSTFDLKTFCVPCDEGGPQRRPALGRDGRAVFTGGLVEAESTQVLGLGVTVPRLFWTIYMKCVTSVSSHLLKWDYSETCPTRLSGGANKWAGGRTAFRLVPATQHVRNKSLLLTCAATLLLKNHVYCPPFVVKLREIKQLAQNFSWQRLRV